MGVPLRRAPFRSASTVCAPRSSILLRGPALLLGLALGGLVSVGTDARAGGFEMPANGTEALARGGAFTAKADSPLALEYNVGGLGGQRGTRMVFDNNLWFGEYRFQRAGGDASGPYPEIRTDASTPFYAPWFGLSTDFGFFRRITFAIGAFGPSSVGRRTYPLFVPTEGGGLRPGPGRYDVLATNLLIVFPTIAMGIHAHRVIDFGISVQQVSAVLNLASASYAPLANSNAPCGEQPEDSRCDAFTRVRVKSFDNFALAFGTMIHPMPSLDIGLHVRSAVNLGIRPITAKGTVAATTPPALSDLPPLGTERMDAEFQTWLPWQFRFGLRYAYKKAERQVFDVEVDGTYEAWSWNDTSDNKLTLVKPPMLVNRGMPFTILLRHNYRDTFSIRAGGSYTQPLSEQASLTLRLGAFVDSSSTRDENIRLDFDTLTKIGGTGGLGLTVRGITLNVAYAYLYSVPRTVENGALSPVNGTNGMPLSFNDMLAPAVNNGSYSGQTHLVSLGLSVLFDDLVKGAGWVARNRG